MRKAELVQLLALKAILIAKTESSFTRRCAIFFLGIGFTFSALAQDLPVLGAPSTLSGTTTSAQFFGGSSLRGGNVYSSSFQNTHDVAVQLRIEPQQNHIGSSGTSYVLAIVGGAAFARIGADEWIPFDGTVAGLGGAASYGAFRNTETLSADGVFTLLSNPAVTSDSGAVSVFVYMAYDTSAAPGELYFNGNPLQFRVTLNKGLSAQELFTTQVESPIVQSRCIACHVEGGIADSTGLQFERSSGTSAVTNLAAIKLLTTSRNDALDYILAKASGNTAHGGGRQLAVGGTDYNNLQSLLDVLINGGTGTASSDVNFFTGVELLSPQKTLRRAAIVIAGRAPTEAEYAAVEGADEAALRSTIRAMMQGENFHEFLLDGSNDRLLVRAGLVGNFLDGRGIFPNYTNTLADFKLGAFEAGKDFDPAEFQFQLGVIRGIKESPLELIAYVVENERPYSEILTADYMMTNPYAAFAMDATGSFENPEDYGEFQPVTLDRYYSYSRETLFEYDSEIGARRLIDPGSLSWKFPHAGVLNTQAFLIRYPTTATNRNRARARWTFLHFLDIDIERSAPRTTDAAALADTNNPTMFNQNCTVCHSNLDPVAGAFQNYSEEGIYRINGYDSLDFFYKFDKGNPLFQAGDSWYRDMRTPGLFGQEATDNSSSMQWLAQHIVQQPGFDRATVKFWWPSIIGTEPLLQPEIQTDANYQANLMAYDAQTATIEEIANSFSTTGMNLKEVLLDLVMSPWFRASSVNETELDAVEAEAHDIANLGSERLLTPEQLIRKTTSLTGYKWGRRYDFQLNRESDVLSNDYAVYYGGIDSEAITKRSYEITALMSEVAMLHATESSCPIVLREFGLNDGNRKLFNGIAGDTTPLTEKAAQYSIATVVQNVATQSQGSVKLTMDTTPRNLYVSADFTASIWNFETQQSEGRSFLEIDRLDLRLPNGVTTSIEASPANTVLGVCANYSSTNVNAKCSGAKLIFPYTPSMAGEFEITAVVRGVRVGEDPSLESVVFSVGVERAVSSLDSTSLKTTAIHTKIVDLYKLLHGKEFAIDSWEVSQAYELFAASWNEARTGSNSQSNTNVSYGELTCIISDYQIGVGLPILDPPTKITTLENGISFILASPEATNYLRQVGGVDTSFAKRAWVTVLTYMLSHYDYLYE
ncbi:MAG: hypothetical protein ACI95C_000637 [Pseudohongiellaceae bacterium]